MKSLSVQSLTHVAIFDGGWLFAALMFLWLISKEVIKKGLTTGLDKLSEVIYACLAGSRMVSRLAARSYRKWISKQLGTFFVPFSDNLQLDMGAIYVPLRRILETTEEEGNDAYASVRSEPCSVVVGPPGAGKSMLLRHSMLAWADSPPTSVDDDRIPVIVELRRCDGISDLEEYIIAALKRSGFRGANRFVNRALLRGDLTVLFDGLDEVETHKRTLVTDQLKDLANKYQDAGCQFIVTCRAAIYEGQLRPEYKNMVRVAEFDDAQIARFLSAWPHMRDKDAPNQLLAALADAPRIKQLARNPLLLTMIAILYSEIRPGDKFTLPTSRAQFYKEAISELLRMKKERTYREPEKRAVLQRLALMVHDYPIDTPDRLTLSYAQVVHETTDVILQLNLEASDALPLLDELVERSGLLQRIDGGARYQFSHLSLQEFLAAAELTDDPEGLLQRFRRDQTAWREPLKLWCGLVSRDCTSVIREVYSNDPALAFECLVEASKIDDVLVTDITSHFEERFKVTDALQSPLIDAFAAVAADGRPRGRRVFEWLTKIANTVEWPQQSLAAATALSKTNLPAAAVVLSELADHNSSVRQALTAMGDLAVPALSARAQNGWAGAIVDLTRIGTVRAAFALVSMIWTTDKVAFRASWAVGTLLRSSDIRRALESYPLGAQGSGDSLEWVNYPFEAETPPNLSRIIGRVAWLLDNCPPDDVPVRIPIVDQQISLPLAAIKAGEYLALDDHDLSRHDHKVLATAIGSAESGGSWKRYRHYFTGDAGSTLLSNDNKKLSQDKLCRLAYAILFVVKLPTAQLTLYQSLEPALQLELFVRMCRISEVRDKRFGILRGFWNSRELARRTAGRHSHSKATTDISYCTARDWTKAFTNERKTHWNVFICGILTFAMVAVLFGSIGDWWLRSWWIQCEIAILIVMGLLGVDARIRSTSNAQAMASPLRGLLVIGEKARRDDSSIIAK
jgi:hypothetical protein